MTANEALEAIEEAQFSPGPRSSTPEQVAREWIEEADACTLDEILNLARDPEVLASDGDGYRSRWFTFLNLVIAWVESEPDGALAGWAPLLSDDQRRRTALFALKLIAIQNPRLRGEVESRIEGALGEFGRLDEDERADLAETLAVLEPGFASKIAAVVASST